MPPDYNAEVISHLSTKNLSVKSALGGVPVADDGGSRYRRLEGRDSLPKRSKPEATKKPFWRCESSLPAPLSGAVRGPRARRVRRVVFSIFHIIIFLARKYQDQLDYCEIKNTPIGKGSKNANSGAPKEIHTKADMKIATTLPTPIHILFMKITTTRPIKYGNIKPT